MWDDSCQLAFTTLKDALLHAPILKYPDFSSTSKQFQLYTDASDTDIGAVLEQYCHVIAYTSRALSSSERNYSVIQKECLAVVHSLKQFRHYILVENFPSSLTMLVVVCSENGRVTCQVGPCHARI